jgi:hypothetical protein
MRLSGKPISVCRGRWEARGPKAFAFFSECNPLTGQSRAAGSDSGTQTFAVASLCLGWGDCPMRSRRHRPTRACLS